MSETPWQTCKRAGIPCSVCGKLGSCTVSPDGAAFKCWRDGGKVHQTGIGQVGGNGNGYVGKGHQKPKSTNRSARAHSTPEAAIAAIGRTIIGAKLAGVWTYQPRRGAEVMKVARFDLPDGEKEFRPIHLAKDGWRIGDPSGPLPLYRLPDLPDAGTLYVCEGEKATEAARSLGLPATTSAHGSSAAEKSDWTPLAGRDVVILPDRDEPGAKYGRDVARLLLKISPAAQVKIVELPDLPAGGDVVEYIASHPDTAPEAIREDIEARARAARLIDACDIIGGPVLLSLADIEARQIRWLWQGRIPLGRITLLVGRPGEGKSLLTTDMAARVTTGTPWPDGSPCPVGSVILVSAEDDPGDTIRPRLDAHHADCRRVHLLSAVRRVDAEGKGHDVLFSLADVSALESALKAHPDCRLIVVDPIGSFLGGDTDSHRDNEVRSVLAPVARLAEKYGPAVVIVAHRRKSAGSIADDLALGSRAFTGIARAVWHLTRDSENKARRLLLPGKNNLAPEGDGLAFTIGGDPPAVIWERGAVAMSADDALAVENGERAEKPGPEPVKQKAAKEWLQSRLSAGPVYVGDPTKPAPGTIRADVKEAGLSWATVRRAADELGVRSEKCPYSGKYQWRLLKLVAHDASGAEDLSNLSNQQVSGETVLDSMLPADGCAGSDDLSNHASNDEYERLEREAIQTEGIDLKMASPST